MLRGGVSVFDACAYTSYGGGSLNGCLWDMCLSKNPFKVVDVYQRFPSPRDNLIHQREL